MSEPDFVWPIRHDEFCHHQPHLHTTIALAADPYDEDGYCCWCGNGKWKFHSPWCTWADQAEGLIELLLMMAG